MIIEIDPHNRWHAAAAVNGSDEAVAELQVAASKSQVRELLAGRLSRNCCYVGDLGQVSQSVVMEMNAPEGIGTLLGRWCR